MGRKVRVVDMTSKRTATAVELIDQASEELIDAVYASTDRDGFESGNFKQHALQILLKLVLEAR